MKITIAIISTTLGFLWSGACAQSPAASEGLTETFNVVSLSRGGELNVLVSKRSGTNPTIAALLFPGYPGILRLRSEAGAVTYTLMGNFLVRARRFLNSDKVFTVLVDCPFDQWSACSDTYRSSSQHAADIADVAAAMKTAFGAQHVYVVGTSYGTVSSSFLAKNLGDKIDGAVHTATLTDPRSGRKCTWGADAKFRLDPDEGAAAFRSSQGRSVRRDSIFECGRAQERHSIDYR